MRSAPPSPSRRRAWTLVEIMVVVVIVALLCLGAWRGYSVYVERGRFAACNQRIANFGQGLRGYVSEHGQWPQEDVLRKDGNPPDEDKLWDWWFTQLKDQGIGEDDWFCPSDIEARKQEAKMDKEEHKGETGFTPAIKDPSYIPMKFEQGPYAPYDDLNFPWAHETRGHPMGLHKVMPNGSVQVEFNFKAVPRNLPKNK